MIVLVILSFGHTSIVNAQKNIKSEFDSIHTELDVESRVEELSKRYSKTHMIAGYRIQIISSNKKDKAHRMKSAFVSRQQQIKAHEIYQQPFFIVKVGDFLTKLEAEKFHRQIREDFPESFVLPDAVLPYHQYAEKD